MEMFQARNEVLQRKKSNLQVQAGSACCIDRLRPGGMEAH